LTFNWLSNTEGGKADKILATRTEELNKESEEKAQKKGRRDFTQIDAKSIGMSQNGEDLNVH